MNKFLLSIILSLAISSLIAQDAIHYQGIAFDQNDQPVVSSDISLFLKVVENGPGGAFAYMETHDVVPTGSDGSFSVEIGLSLIHI